MNPRARRWTWAASGGLFLLALVVASGVVRLSSVAGRQLGVAIVLFALSILLAGIGAQLAVMKRGWRIALGIPTVAVTVWLLLVAYVFASVPILPYTVHSYERVADGTTGFELHASALPAPMQEAVAHTSLGAGGCAYFSEDEWHAFEAAFRAAGGDPDALEGQLTLAIDGRALRWNEGPPCPIP